MIRARLVLLLALPLVLAADQDGTFTARVVGITDGDTLTVLRDRAQIKIRLHGIDCPETGQDFSARAKEVASALAFGKVVTVQPGLDLSDG